MMQRSRHHSSQSRRLTRKLAGYTAAGAALAAVEAEAAVIYQDLGPSGTSISLYLNPPFELDLNGDGLSDFEFHTHYSQNMQATCRNTSTSNSTCTTYTNFYTQLDLQGVIDNAVLLYADRTFRRTHGNIIDPRAETLPNVHLLMRAYTRRDGDVLYGAFAGMRGYVGIVFEIPDQGLHAGWLEFEGISNEEIRMYGIAYETIPGKAIAAGAVPEPPSLALLAAGAAGLALLRRRRGRPETA